MNAGDDPAGRTGAGTVVPAPAAFRELDPSAQATDGRSRILRAAVCDAGGRPAERFVQGESIHVFLECEIKAPFDGVVASGLEFRDATGAVVHGSNAFLAGTGLAVRPAPGTRLLFHHVVKLDLGAGAYVATAGIASCSEAASRAYLDGELGHLTFSARVAMTCSVPRVATFDVVLPALGPISHFGIAALPGSIELVEAQIAPAAAAPGDTQPAAPAITSAALPTILHFTHWKAGSQWIYRILRELAPERVVEPLLGNAEFRNHPVRPGCIYPTLYLSVAESNQVPVPGPTRRFVVIRDLRDTLVSAYFSFRISHAIVDAAQAEFRQQLGDDVETGLVRLMDSFLPGCAAIQLSWLEAGEPLLRYEDLLEHDVEILEELLVDRLGITAERPRVREVVLASRFEALAGRPRGMENVAAHERRGVAGDWRNHFTPRVTAAFKTRFGGLLVATGYESGLDWQP